MALKERKPFKPRDPDRITYTPVGCASDPHVSHQDAAHVSVDITYYVAWLMGTDRTAVHPNTSFPSSFRRSLRRGRKSAVWALVDSLVPSESVAPSRDTVVLPCRMRSGCI